MSCTCSQLTSSALRVLFRSFFIIVLLCVHFCLNMSRTSSIASSSLLICVSMANVLLRKSKGSEVRHIWMCLSLNSSTEHWKFYNAWSITSMWNWIQKWFTLNSIYATFFQRISTQHINNIIYIQQYCENKKNKKCKTQGEWTIVSVLTFTPKHESVILFWILLKVNFSSHWIYFTGWIEK